MTQRAHSKLQSFLWSEVNVNPQIELIFGSGSELFAQRKWYDAEDWRLKDRVRGHASSGNWPRWYSAKFRGLFSSDRGSCMCESANRSLVYMENLNAMVLFERDGRIRHGRQRRASGGSKRGVFFFSCCSWSLDPFLLDPAQFFSLRLSLLSYKMLSVARTSIKAASKVRVLSRKPSRH